MARYRFTLLEMTIVVMLLAIVLSLALPRIGRLPARLQAEHCVSSLRAILDEAGLRARASGQSLRLTLLVDLQDGGSRFAVSPVSEDPLAVSLGGTPAPSAPLPDSDEGAAPARSDLGLLPATTTYPLPAAVAWDEGTLQEGTAEGEDGPTFIFLTTGEAGGPTLEFTVRKQRHRVTVDRLTGRADIRPVEDR